MPIRYTYIVSINTLPEHADEYRYAYAQTKDIAILIGENGAKIFANIGKDYKEIWEGSYAQKIVRDGIKRCSLIHTIKYSKPMPIDSIVINITKGTLAVACFDVSKKEKLFSLIEGELIRPIAPDLLDEAVLHEIIGEMKKDYGSRTAALNAYLLSKTKTHETEIFVYLWMAFNGVYSYWGEKRGIKTDKAQLENLLDKYGWGKTILNKKSRKKSWEECFPAA